MKVLVHDTLESNVRLGVLELSDIQTPPDSGEAIWQTIESATATIRIQNEGHTVGQVVGVQDARRLYRAIGIDPTKTRPSSEALLRRVIKGKPLYRIHPLVDLFNLVSLTTLTPVGLYDKRHISGDTVTVRIGTEGEGYDGIRKGWVNLEGRFLVADAVGPFGSPTSDSQRTAIEGSVSDVLAVFFSHSDTPSSKLTETLAKAESLCRTHLGARTVMKTIVPH